MKSSFDPGLMRCYRWSQQGVLVGMAECSNMEVGNYLCHSGSVLLSGECETGAAAAEGCLEDRAPGSQVVAQK